MADANTGPLVRHRLQVHFDTHQCQLPRPVLEGMADDLDSLARQVGNFPQADARVHIQWNSRTNEYGAKLTLLLPGETLVTSDHDAVLHAAFERAVASLVDALHRYLERLDGVAERRRQEVGTRPEVAPAAPVDAAALDAAAAAGDYPAFRAAVAPYEEPLRARAGRWVERHPALQARIGRGLEVADVVDGVFLAAFEAHARRPDAVRYGVWLETLIDPVVRALERDPAGELQNINMARSACG